MKQINLTTFRDKWHAYKHDPKSLLLFIAVCLAAAITLAALAFVIIYILAKGVPYLTPGAVPMGIQHRERLPDAGADKHPLYGRTVAALRSAYRHIFGSLSE